MELELPTKSVKTIGSIFKKPMNQLVSAQQASFTFTLTKPPSAKNKSQGTQKSDF